MTVIDDAVAEVMCETRDLRKGQRYPSHKGEGEQHILAVDPHGVEIATGRAQPAQLNAAHHRQARLKHVLHVRAVGY